MSEIPWICLKAALKTLAILAIVIGLGACALSYDPGSTGSGPSSDEVECSPFDYGCVQP